MLTNNVIPTLREVMVALKGRPVMVNLDKSFPYYEEAFAILQETGSLRQAIFKATVGYAELKTRYGRLLDSIIYMPVVDLDKPGARVWINSLWPRLNGGHDDNRAVEEGDIKGSWGWLIAHGATIIQTDRPRELIKYLRN